MAESKPLPYTCDLGHLFCSDPNPLPSLKATNTDAEKEAILAFTARDCAQTLINELLSKCPISRSADDGNLQITLPAPMTQLPREKMVPKDKEKSKWEKFAAKKGISSKRNQGKLVFDEAKKEWVPRYGFKGKNQDAEWLVEVDEKAEKEGEADERGARKKTKKSR